MFYVERGIIPFRETPLETEDRGKPEAQHNGFDTGDLRKIVRLRCAIGCDLE